MSPKSRYSTSIAEFAASQGVTPRTVRNWIAAGLVDAVRVGPKVIRIDPDSMQVRPVQYTGGGVR